MFCVKNYTLIFSRPIFAKSLATVDSKAIKVDFHNKMINKCTKKCIQLDRQTFGLFFESLNYWVTVETYLEAPVNWLSGLLSLSKITSSLLYIINTNVPLVLYVMFNCLLYLGQSKVNFKIEIRFFHFISVVKKKHIQPNI